MNYRFLYLYNLFLYGSHTKLTIFYFQLVFDIAQNILKQTHK